MEIVNSHASKIALLNLTNLILYNDNCIGLHDTCTHAANTFILFIYRIPFLIFYIHWFVFSQVVVPFGLEEQQQPISIISNACG